MLGEYFGTTVYIITTLYMIICLFRLLIQQPQSMLLFFSLAAAVCLFLSNLYWMAYDLLRPNVRMPFAANEFGELAACFLLSSSLVSVIRVKLLDAMPEVLLAALFVAANVLLWIGWSGEWLQDILTGLSYGYLVCTITAALKKEKVFSRPVWLGIGAVAAVLILGQCGTFLLPEKWSHLLDLFCYMWMMASIVLCFALRFQAVRTGRNTKTVLILSFASHAWTTAVMYMSAGIFYIIAELALCLSLLLILSAIGKEVEGG